MNQLKIALATYLLVMTGLAMASHQDHSTIEQRTAPTGKVYRVGDDVPVAEAPVVEASGPRSGEEIYSTKCAMCHAAGVAGAPKSGDSAAWSARIAQGEAVLFEHAINGFQGSAGFMPAKGGCSDCSDEETTEAVKHMLSLLN